MNLFIILASDQIKYFREEIFVMKKIVSILLVMLLLISSVPMMASAANVNESEDNNSYAKANTLNIGNTIKGKMNNSSDEDYYKITTSSTGKLYISFDHDYVEDGTSWIIKIYQYINNSYTELSSAEIGAKDSGNYALPFVGTIANGTYYVRVYCGFYKPTGIEYRLSTKFTATNFAEQEVNNSYPKANLIILNNEYSGTMNNSSDEDFYKINTLSTGKLYISFDHDYVEDSTSWIIKIFKYANNEYSELSSVEVSAKSSGNYVLPFVGTVANGTYYVRVYCGFYKPTGIEYRLSTKFTATNFAEQELNNSYQTANTIVLNKEYTGTMNSGEDRDFYKITASATGNIPVTFNHKYKNQSGSWIIAVYSYQNNEYKELGHKEISIKNSVESNLIYTISAAKNVAYFVKITNGYYKTTGNEYTILLGQKSASTTYTVTYNTNGGSVSPSSASVTSGGSVTLPTPTKTGYTCLGWSTSGSATTASYSCGSSYKPSQNITLYAIWKKNAPTMCTLTYNANGGSVSPSSATFEMGKTVTLPTPTRSGYTFDGWYTAKDGGTKVSESLKVTANITLYAHWTKIEQHIPTVKSVKIDDNAEINYKSSYKISSEITAESGAEYTAEWQSSNPKVASVDKNGKVTALKKGTAKITCTVTDSYGNTVSDTCNVTVKYSFGQWLIIILLFGWIWY